MKKLLSNRTALIKRTRKSLRISVFTSCQSCCLDRPVVSYTARPPCSLLHDQAVLQSPTRLGRPVVSYTARPPCSLLRGQAALQSPTRLARHVVSYTVSPPCSLLHGQPALQSPTWLQAALQSPTLAVQVVWPGLPCRSFGLACRAGRLAWLAVQVICWNCSNIDIFLDLLFQALKIGSK